MNIFIKVITFCFINCLYSSATELHDLRERPDGLQIFYDKPDPMNKNDPKWYDIEASGLSSRAAAIVCHSIHNSAFFYSTAAGVESPKERVNVGCGTISTQISHCLLSLSKREKLGRSVTINCLDVAGFGGGSLIHLEDNSVFMLQMISPELFVWGLICINDPVTNNITCLSLYNQGVEANTSSIQNVHSLQRLTNFSCRPDTERLADCSFESSIGSDCSNAVHTPLECIPPTSPSGPGPLNPLKSGFLTFPETNVVTTGSTTTTTATTPVSISTTLPPSTNNIPTTHTQATDSIVVVAAAAAAAGALSICIVASMLTCIICIVSIVTSRRKRKKTEIRYAMELRQESTNLDYETVEPEEEIASAYANAVQTIHRSLSISSQTGAQVKYQPLLPKEVLSELTGVCLRSLEPPEDELYDQIINKNDTVVPNEEDRKSLDLNSSQENVYLALSSELPCFLYQNAEIWEPDCTVKGIYAQMAEKRFREINITELTIRDLLGEGNFGYVNSGTWRVYGGGLEVPVAIKSLKVETKESCVSFLQEAAILGQFNHPNVIKLLGVVTLSTPIMMVTELMRSGLKDLLHLIADSNTISLKNLDDLFLRFTLEIASGMAHLALKKHVHRDLAARNILVSQNLNCKIGDFGLARGAQVDDEYYLSQGGLVPVKWTAPEAMIFKKYSEKSDVFSYGVTLYEIWSVGEVPWEGIDNEIIIKKVYEGIVMSPPARCPRNIYKLMVSCWHPTKDHRPTFKDIISRLQNRCDMLQRGKDNSRAVREGSRARRVFGDLQDTYVKSKQVYFDI